MSRGEFGPRRVVGLTMALGAIFAACGGSGGSESTGASMTIFISGSSTVEPISALVAEAFEADHPDIAFKVDGPGTGDGFKLFCGGETDISDASRAIKPAEAATCASSGIEFIELKVAIDGLSVITSIDNSFVDCLSFPDLYALIGPESTRFDNWTDAEVLAAQVGGAGGFPDVELTITAPGEESGTYDTFVELVLEDIAGRRGKPAEARIDYQSSPNDNVIVDGISGNETALGWVGYSFAEENRDTLKLLDVEETPGDGCVAPTPATIADGSYPLSRPLFIYVNVAKLASNPVLGPFVDYYLSDAGYEAVADAGYVELDAATLADTRQVWSAKTAGSREP